MIKKLLSVVASLLLLITLVISCQKDALRNDHLDDNKPPIANAGRDTVVVLPQDSFLLDGTASYDPDGTIDKYLWSKISGPSASTADPNAVQTQVTSLVEGVYQFELKVTDAGGLSSKDTVQFIVTPQNSACNIDSRPVIQARLVPLGTLSISRENMLAAAANNKVLFVGGSIYGVDYTGNSTRLVDIYDINSNSWSTKSLGWSPAWRLDMGIAATNNKIFIAGGGFWGDDIYTNEVNVYNAADNSWSSTSLSESRTALTGVFAGDKVFFAGGYSNPGGVSNAVDIYDNATDTWTRDTLTESRRAISAVGTANKVYFAGGHKYDGQTHINLIDEYDFLTSSWSTSTLHEARSNMAAIAAGNKVFWAGGESNGGVSGTVEIRDIVTGNISFACIVPRAGFSAVLKDDKIVFFTGYGSDPRNGTHFEIYNLTTDTWSTGVLDKSIVGAAIISVNNVIYVAGGIVNGVQVWTLEF